MNRTGVSFFLSAALHAALIAAFTMLPSHEEPVVKNTAIRVTLRKTESVGAPGPSGPTGAEDVNLEQTTEEKIEPVEPPEKEIPVEEIPAMPTEPPKAIQPVQTKIEEPVEEAAKMPVEPPKNAAPIKRETPPEPKPKSAAKPEQKPAAKPEGKKPPAPPAKQAEVQQASARAAPPSPNATQQSGAAAAVEPSPVAANNQSGTEKTAPESPAPAPKILDAATLKITKKVNADYPMISRKRKEQGTVVLLIEITSGRVSAVEIEKSSGHPPLDEAAIRAVKEWRFDTSGYGDKVTARILFRFDLK
jgi:protein TonB